MLEPIYAHEKMIQYQRLAEFSRVLPMTDGIRAFELLFEDNSTWYLDRVCTYQNLTVVFIVAVILWAPLHGLTSPLRYLLVRVRVSSWSLPLRPVLGCMGYELLQLTRQVYFETKTSWRRRRILSTYVKILWAAPWIFSQAVLSCGNSTQQMVTSPLLYAHRKSWLARDFQICWKRTSLRQPE